MKLSDLIEEMIDMKNAGEPANNGWQSIDHVNLQREAYRARLLEIKSAIDSSEIGKALKEAVR